MPEIYYQRPDGKLYHPIRKKVMPIERIQDQIDDGRVIVKKEPSKTKEIAALKKEHQRELIKAKIEAIEKSALRNVIALAVNEDVMERGYLNDKLAQITKLRTELGSL